MKKLLLILLSAFWLANVYGQRTFYISDVIGDDSRTPQQAQNSTSPWKTIKKVNDYINASAANNLTAGEKILFRKGEVFPGTLVLASSGTLQAPIVISSYPNTSNLNASEPTLTGAIPAKQWYSEPNGIWRFYKAPEAITGTNNPTSNCQQLFVNSVKKFQSRYPNTGWLYIDTKISASQFTDAAISSLPSSFFEGSSIAIRMKEWFWGKSAVTVVEDGTVVLASSLYDEPDPSEGYYFHGAKEMIDLTHEWSSTAAGVLYYKAESGVDMNAANAPAVQASYYTNGIITSKNHITISNLNIERYEFGLSLTGSQYVTVDNCKFRDCRSQGVRAWTNVFGATPVATQYLKVLNSKFFNIGNNGILLYKANNAEIMGNEIKNIGTDFIGYTENENTSNGIMSVYGNSNTFSKNIIDYVGKNGIMLNDSVCIVEKNIISRFGQTSSDLGGIYTAGINNKRHVIRNNFTFGGVSYLDAWNNGDTGSTNHAADRAAGLYNDIANDDCVWEYNTTYDNDFCGMEHVTGRKQKWRYNVSYKNKRTEMAWMELPSNLNIASYVRPIGWANTNELEGNVLYRAGERAISDPQIMSMYKAQQNLNFISVSKNNKFYNPFRPTQKFISANRSGSYSTTSFEQYVSTYADQGSVLCPTILQQTSSTNVADDRSVLFTNMRDNIRVVGLQGSWYDLDGNTLSSNITIDPWYSKIIIRGANGTYTSVKNITHDDKSMLEIFPNPAKAFVNIKINNILPTNAKLYITDMLGKAIKIIALSASDNILQVPLSDFQSGMYYVGLVGVQKSTFQKLVIQ